MTTPRSTPPDLHNQAPENLPPDSIDELEPSEASLSEAAPTPEEDVPQDAAEATDEPQAQARWHTRWNIALCVLACAVAIAGWRWVSWRQSVAYQPPLEVSAVSTPASESSAIPDATIAATPAPKKILVHVIGLVKKPGVFEMPGGARLKDALHFAGGPLPGADLESINLAEPLEDGQQYRVPERQNAATRDAQAAPQVLAASPRPQGRATRSARTSPATSSSAAQPRAASAKAPPQPIDINSATLEELQGLPGVGPATAQKILEYRDEIGGFKSVDDLDGVKGIGPKKLEKMRPFALVR